MYDQDLFLIRNSQPNSRKWQVRWRRQHDISDIVYSAASFYVVCVFEIVDRSHFTLSSF